MAGQALGHLRTLRCTRHGTLQHGFMNVKPGRRAEAWVSADPCGRKHELPSPIRRSIDLLAPDGKWQHDAPETARQVFLVRLPNILQM
jgi:hypothetical protein